MLLTLLNYCSVFCLDPKSINNKEDTNNSIQVGEFYTEHDDIVNIDGNTHDNQMANSLHKHGNAIPEVPEVLKDEHIRERYVEEGI